MTGTMEAHMIIRPAGRADEDAIWQILEPTIRDAETYTLPRDLSRLDALAYWFAPGNLVRVAEDDRKIVGTYYLRPNQQGGGSHVANCGYMTAMDASGRGVATAMCRHSLGEARSLGYMAMQFNFVVSTNAGAVRLWKALGFDIVGTLPRAFQHPRLGYVDAFVMYRHL